MLKDEKNYAKILEATGRQQGWWDAPGMVLAFSGGGDSMAMALMLHRHWGGRAVWAHLDHVTKDDSAQDADFAQGLAAQYGVAFVRERIPVYELDRKKESIEMAGRRVRYDFLQRAAAEHGLPFVALAHTADDQAETVIMHIIRGTGLYGLSGIMGRRDIWVRPVINFTKQELKNYLLLIGQDKWVEDVTNTYPIYRRNRIRHHLIPWVNENFNAAFGQRVLGLREEAAAYRDADEKRSDVLLKWLARQKESALACWDRKGAANMSDGALNSCIRAQGRALNLSTLDRLRCEQLAVLIKKPGKFRFQWEGNIEVQSDRGKIFWVSIPQKTTSPLER